MRPSPITKHQRVTTCLKSAIQRDTKTIDRIKAEKSENPQLLKQVVICETRVEFAESILRAMEHGDFSDLLTFTDRT